MSSSLSTKTSFKHKDLNLQSEEVMQSVHNKCEEAALGGYITIRSNPARSDMNVEVHTSMMMLSCGNHFIPTYLSIIPIYHTIYISVNRSSPQS